MPKYKLIEGQCGTCRWAVGFDFADGPSGAEDGVHCASADHARELDSIGQADLAEEFRTQGYMQLWRLEALAEEDFRCAYWQPKKGSD